MDNTIKNTGNFPGDISYSEEKEVAEINDGVITPNLFPRDSIIIPNVDTPAPIQPDQPEITD